MEQFNELLNNCKIKGDGEYTHFNIDNSSKLIIKNGDLCDFWRYYCESVISGNNKVNIAEKVGLFSPLISKVILRSKEEDVGFQEEFIKHLVYIYQRVLAEKCILCLQAEADKTVEIKKDKKTDNKKTGSKNDEKELKHDFKMELWCVVLESDKPKRYNDEYLYEYILHFPYTKIDINFQIKEIRDEVIKTANKLEIVELLPSNFMNDSIDNCLGTIGFSKHYPMYGSSEDGRQFTISRYYGEITKSMLNDDIDHEDLFMRVFKPTDHSDFKDGKIPYSLVKGENSEWLPFLLSMSFTSKVTEINRKDESTYSNTFSDRWMSSYSSTSSRSSNDFSETMKPEDMAEILIPMLSRERFSHKHYWIDVGKALYNIYRGSNKGLDIWKRCTEKGGKFNPNECETKYYEYSIKNPLTIKTLAYYARLDNPQYYNEWHDAYCEELMKIATSGSHHDVSMALYYIYWLDFACASSEKKRWYVYTNHYWTLVDDAIPIKKYISGDFRIRFEKMRTVVSKQIDTTTDDRVKEMGELMMKKITELVKKLKNVTFKSLVLKDSIEKFHDDNFLKYADSDPCITGLMNGVIQVCGDYACVREGKPEDYITKASNVLWKNYSPNDPMVLKVKKWMKQIFPDDELYHYAMKMFSSCLKSGTMDKSFFVLTGEGDNSKSMLKCLAECAFGVYCHTFPTTLFTGQRGCSSNASPELAAADKAKMCWAQEPDNEETLRTGVFKELSGGDTFFVRKLNENGGLVEPTFKIFFMCNKIPSFASADKATKTRLKIIPFLSKWVDDAPENEDDQMRERRFKRNNEFKSEIPSMAPAFMWLLVDYWKYYVKEGLKQPDIVTRTTQEYWEENDVYKQFESEYVEPAVIISNNGEKKIDTNSYVNLSEYYRDFKFWFKESYPNTKPPERNWVKHELIQRWGKPTRNGWCGVRMNRPTVQNGGILNI